jgi:hypothetical protein
MHDGHDGNGHHHRNRPQSHNRDVTCRRADDDSHLTIRHGGALPKRKCWSAEETAEELPSSADSGERGDARTRFILLYVECQGGGTHTRRRRRAG